MRGEGQNEEGGREGAFFDHSPQKGEREEERGNGKNAAANLDLEYILYMHTDREGKKDFRL